MREKFQQLIEQLKKLVWTGFFSIVGANTLVKVITFCGGVVLVRVLSKSEYGIYSYVNNTIGFLILLGDMGTGLTTMQFSQEYYKSEKLKGFCAFGLKVTILFSIIPAICILTSPYYFPYTIKEAIPLTVALTGIPFLNNLNTFLQTNLRIHLKNNKYAILCVISIMVHYIVLLPLAFQWGVKGAIYANYGYMAVTLFWSILFNKGSIYINNEDKKYLTRREKKEFIKYAIPTQLNSIAGQIMTLLDVFIIGLVYANENAIASYKIAATIPSACAFIPASIMLYITPYMARNRTNKIWLKRNIPKLLKYSIALYAIIAFIAIITSSWLIPLLFGPQYKDSIECYIILMIGFVFYGGIQAPVSNVLYTQRKIRVSLMITILGGISNILLCVVGIKVWGITGVAIASTANNMLIGLSAGGYIRHYIRNLK